MKTEVLRVKNLWKTENGVPVLEGVNFHVFPGEMVSIIGLQQSGKSMLVNILSGAEKPDRGLILMDDEPQQFSSIAEAQRAGIYSMKAELQLIRSMSIAENFFVVDGNKAGKGVFSAKRHVAMAREVLKRFDLDFDPRTKVRDFSRAEQRKLELVKIALQRPKLIVSDGSRDFYLRDSSAFHAIYQKILETGISVLSISNKLDNVVFESDRTYPLRGGVLGMSIPRAAYSRERLFRAMTGQNYTPPEALEHRRAASAAPALLTAEKLRVGEGNTRFDFTLYQGEILGLIIPDAVQGRALAYTLFGEQKPRSGRLRMDGQVVRLRGAWDAIQRGISMVPNDVKENGVFNALSLRENIALPALAQTHRKTGVLPGRMADYITKRMAEHYRISYRDLHSPLEGWGLQAGDRQKITIARWAAMGQKVYVFLNPFDNVDERLAGELEAIFRELAAGGAGVLLISAGTYKLQGLCSRVHYEEQENIFKGKE